MKLPIFGKPEPTTTANTQTTRGTRPVLAMLALLLAALVPFTALAARPDLPSEQHQALGAVSQATAKYHDVAQAIADGYEAPPHCVEVPGIGGMGYHYYNPQLASDLELDPLRPELLLYAPTGNGLKLVAVEYFVPDLGQGAPSLFGTTFDGPMDGHEPGMPRHYDLHVWLWRANPEGIFTGFNPTVRC